MKQIARGEQQLPAAKELGMDGKIPYFFVGDETFPLKSYVMRSFSKEFIYDVKLCASVTSMHKYKGFQIVLKLCSKSFSAKLLRLLNQSQSRQHFFTQTYFLHPSSQSSKFPSICGGPLLTHVQDKQLGSINNWVM